MTTRSNPLLLWTPRVLGVAVCLFLSVFALDAFSPGKPLGESLADFAIHVAPMILLLGVVALAWRWPLVGAVVFIGLAAGYAFMTRSHPSWIPVIAGPLLTVGVLFLASWVGGRTARGPRWLIARFVHGDLADDVAGEIEERWQTRERRSTASTTEAIDVVAPRPSASTSTAATARPGRAIPRRAA